MKKLIILKKINVKINFNKLNKILKKINCNKLNKKEKINLIF